MTLKLTPMENQSKSKCCGANKALSISTLKGRRCLCNACGKPFKLTPHKEEPAINRITPEKEARVERLYKEQEVKEEWRRKFDKEFTEVILDQEVRTVIKGIKSFISSIIIQERKKERELLKEKIERYNNKNTARYFEDKSKKSANEIILDILSILSEK